MALTESRLQKPRTTGELSLFPLVTGEHLLHSTVAVAGSDGEYTRNVQTPGVRLLWRSKGGNPCQVGIAYRCFSACSHDLMEAVGVVSRTPRARISLLSLPPV